MVLVPEWPDGKKRYDPDLIAGFKSGNRDSRPVILPPARQYRVEDKAAIRSAFGSDTDDSDSEEDPWETFYRRYPRSRGTIAFSRPGYSKDGKAALVYVEHSCGRLCGEAWRVTVRRSFGRWHIEATERLWVS